MKVKVKINSKIASKGGGFYDIQGKQNIYPSSKNGKIDIDEVFTVEATEFVEAKIASGELVLICRGEDKDVTYEVYKGSEKLTELAVKEGATEEEIFSQLAKNKEYQGLLKDHKVTGYSIEQNKIMIKVK